MRQIETATTNELIHAVRAIRVRLSCELAGQWGIGPTSFIDVDRCVNIIAAYEERAGITLTAERQLIGDIKAGRQRGE